MNKKIVFLVSGGGGTLKFVYFAIKQLHLPFEIVGIIADRKTELEAFAVDNSIYYNQIIYRRAEPDQLQQELIRLQPDVVITNIHKILDKETLNLFPAKFINLHYSLLPSFNGLIGMETVQQAEIANVGFIGGTCHEVIEEVDAGKIIHQGCFAVDWKKDDKDYVIDTVFKTSCLAILGGITTKIGVNIGATDTLIINEKKVQFSPELPLDNLEFSAEFWKQLRN